MKKYVLVLAIFCFFTRPATAENYAEFKQKMQNDYGFDYSLDITYMGQRGAPNGRKNSMQTVIDPSFVWTNFDNEYGTGSLNFSYNIVRYGGISANHLANNIGVVTPINDYTDASNTFEALYYQYRLGGDMKWLTLGLGQYQIYNFDGNAYANDQQVNFLNYSLSQNASASYATAGVGAFAQLQLNPEWQAVFGAMDASNLEGISVRTNSLKDKHFATFGFLQYSPTIKGWGDGQYAILLYNQPGVKGQEQTTNGWSLSFSQNVSKKWALFGRINGVSGSVESVRQSWAGGVVCNNPLERNELDQIGLAVAYNKISAKAVSDKIYHNAETVLEGYYAFGLGDYATITPDVQFYINPAGNAKSDYDTVFSLRLSLFF